MKVKKMVEERDTIFLVINLIVAIVTMSLVFVLIGKIVDKDALGTTLFLGCALLFEAIYSIILFFRTKSKKEKLRLIPKKLMNLSLLQRIWLRKTEKLILIFYIM